MFASATLDSEATTVVSLPAVLHFRKPHNVPRLLPVLPAQPATMDSEHSTAMVKKMKGLSQMSHKITIGKRGEADTNENICMLLPLLSNYSMPNRRGVPVKDTFTHVVIG